MSVPASAISSARATPRREWPRLVALLAGGYAISGGVVTLIGWAIPLPRLTDWADRGISMFPNTAIGAMAAGLGLVGLLRLSGAGPLLPGLTRAFATVAALLGGLTLAQHITGMNLGIDELLFEGTWGQAASAAPMRIGVPASMSYLVLGVALLLATGHARARRVASVLALVPIGIAALSLTGYWFGANQLFGIGRFTGIAWQTATIISALGVGLLAAIPEHGLVALLRRDDPGGLLARHMLVPIVAIPLLLGWLRIVGERGGVFDPALGTSVRTLAEIALFLAFLWWTARAISAQAAETRRTSEALRISEERFTRFMQSLPGLAWLKDLEGRYVYANEAGLRAVGRPADEVYGKTDHDLFPPELAAQFAANDRLALANERGHQSVETFTHHDGARRPLLVSKFPVPGSDGRPAFVGGIGIDIADRLHAEEALLQAHRRKDEFLATLAHELRNPLAPIRFAVHLFKSPAVAPAEFQRTVAVVERQVEQMARLLDDLLDVSRISHGKLSLRREPVDLATVVDRAVETSQPLLQSREHPLRIHLPSAPLRFEADPVRLAQVLSNLLNNAAKYSPPGRPITLEAAHREDEVILSVRDEGLGIPADMLPRVFDIFAQVKRSSDHSQGGLGIGLSLVRGIVELHGGEVEARSDGPDRGSEFLVRLPARRASPPAAAPPAAKIPAPETTMRRRILVADDLRDAADGIATLLRAHGHDVRCAYDGEEAVTVAREFRPEIALLDIGMPGLTGHEVCRVLRREPWAETVTIIAITGWGQEADRRLAEEAGFDRHLVKPVDIGTILALLDNVPAPPSG